MFGSTSKLITELRAEIQRLRELVAELRGRNASLEQGYQGMKEVAARALDVAKEKHFPEGRQLSEKTRNRISKLRDYMIEWKSELRADYLADPDPYSVKNCPECSVSVRADSWPQECPNCKTLFGDEEWPERLE